MNDWLFMGCIAVALLIALAVGVERPGNPQRRRRR